MPLSWTPKASDRLSTLRIRFFQSGSQFDQNLMDFRFIIVVLPQMKTTNPKQVPFLVLLFFLFGLHFQGVSQDIVINEYFNDASQNSEWTQLVVLKDDFDLRG